MNLNQQEIAGTTAFQRWAIDAICEAIRQDPASVPGLTDLLGPQECKILFAKEQTDAAETGVLSTPVASNLLPILFHESRVRMGRREDGAVLFALVDIAEAIPHNIRLLRKIIANYPRLFRSRFGSLNDLNSAGGPSEIQALTRDGVIALLTKISPSRIKDPERAERISELQDLIVDIADAVLSGELILIPREEAEQHGYVETGKSLVKNIAAIRKLALTPKYNAGKRGGTLKKKIKKIAEAEGKSPTTINRWIGRYREAGGLGLQAQYRTGPMPPRNPDEAQRIIEYAQAHPTASAKEVWRQTEPSCTYGTVLQIIKKVRGLS